MCQIGCISASSIIAMTSDNLYPSQYFILIVPPVQHYQLYMLTYRNHSQKLIILCLSELQIWIPLLYSLSFSIIIIDRLEFRWVAVYLFVTFRIRTTKVISKSTDNAWKIHAGNSSHMHTGVFKGVGLTTQFDVGLHINIPSAPQQQSSLVKQHSLSLYGSDSAHVLVTKMLQLKQVEMMVRSKIQAVKENTSDQTTTFKGSERFIKVLKQPVRSFATSMPTYYRFIDSMVVFQSRTTLNSYLQEQLWSTTVVKIVVCQITAIAVNSQQNSLKNQI